MYAPSASRSLMIPSTIPAPTPLIASSPNRIDLPFSMLKSLIEPFTSGESTVIFCRRHSSTHAVTRSSLSRYTESSAAMYSTG